MPTIAETFLATSVFRLGRSEADIDRCLARLTDEQILHHAADHENSIANLLLHLSGNLRQWILHGVDHQPDFRIRDEEFVSQPTLSVAEIRERFAATVAECRRVIAVLPEERLLEITDPQPGSGWDAMPILGAIYHIVGHFQLHTGQIILLTKQFTRADLDLSIPRKR